MVLLHSSLARVPCASGRNRNNFFTLSSLLATLQELQVIQQLILHQALVVQKVDSAIHGINLYPLDSAIGLPNTYPRDSDISGGQRYPAFEQLGPDQNKHLKKNDRASSYLGFVGLSLLLFPSNMHALPDLTTFLPCPSCHISLYIRPVSETQRIECLLCVQKATGYLIVPRSRNRNCCILIKYRK